MLSLSTPISEHLSCSDETAPLCATTSLGLLIGPTKLTIIMISSSSPSQPFNQHIELPFDPKLSAMIAADTYPNTNPTQTIKILHINGDLVHHDPVLSRPDNKPRVSSEG